MAISCPICRCHKVDLLQQGVWDAVQRNIYRCGFCKTTFLYPMMNKAENARFYSSQGLQARYKRITSSNKKKFLDLKLKKAAEFQVNSLKKYFAKSQTLCDIGASCGMFLEKARPYVKQVIAVELGQSEQKILRAKKIPYYSQLEDVVKKKVKFDVVTMFHVFEHIPEPLDFVKKLKKVLAPQALVIVEVPNVDDVLISQYNCQAFKKFYFQSMHCFYYNKETLKNVFEADGFSLVSDHYIQRYSLANHLQWLLRAKSGGNVELEKKFSSVKKAYTDLLVSEKLTDTILCIFKNKTKI